MAEYSLSWQSIGNHGKIYKDMAHNCILKSRGPAPAYLFLYGHNHLIKKTVLFSTNKKKISI